MSRVLTPNDIDVIRERHFGWEQAKPALLAAVFGVSVQRITAILSPPSLQNNINDHRSNGIAKRSGGVSFHASMNSSNRERNNVR